METTNKILRKIANTEGTITVASGTLFFPDGTEIDVSDYSTHYGLQNEDELYYSEGGLWSWSARSAATYATEKQARLMAQGLGIAVKIVPITKR